LCHNARHAHAWTLTVEQPLTSLNNRSKKRKPKTAPFGVK